MSMSLGFQCLLQAYFRPELLNRLDETVVFRQLSRVDIATISQLVLQQTSDRLADKGVHLDVSPAVLARIQEEGYDEVGWMLWQHCLTYAAQPCLGAAHRSLVHDTRSEAVSSMLGTPAAPAATLNVNLPCAGLTLCNCSSCTCSLGDRRCLPQGLPP